MVNECRCKFHIGPAGDHTTGTGNFLYMDSSSPRQLLDRARLAHSNLFPAGRGVCTLRFYYNMYGSKLMGYLKVYLLTSGYSRWSEVWKTRGACYQNTYYTSQLSATPRKLPRKVLTLNIWRFRWQRECIKWEQSSTRQWRRFCLVFAFRYCRFCCVFFLIAPTSNSWITSVVPTRLISAPVERFSKDLVEDMYRSTRLDYLN